MKTFTEWLLAESVYYHGTSLENAKSILNKDIDPEKYQSGMFKGFYLTPSPDYFKGFDKQPEVILKVEVDDNEIIDTNAISDKDLDEMDKFWRMSSYGYKNHLIQKWAMENGYSGVRSGKEVILFSPQAVKNIEIAGGTNEQV